MNQITVHCTNGKIWNTIELVSFLNNHQHGVIELTLIPEAMPLFEIGLYDILDCFSFKQVTIHTQNPFESHSRYIINFIKKNSFLLENGSAAEKFQNWNCSKKFLTLYGRPTANRIGIASYLLKNYARDTHLHFSWNTSHDSVLVFELDKLLTYDKDSIEIAGKLIKQMPCTVKSIAGYKKTHYDYSDSLTELYQDVLIDIVSESHVNGLTFFPTEKTFRPIWAKKPFIVFGSKDYLAYLRQMGFRTFADFWDEDYDGFDGRERYIRILKLIDSIAGLSYDQLETMYWDMQFTLEHNYNLLIDKKYNTDITQI